MAGLTGKTIASNYKSLLRVDDDSNGVDTIPEVVTDGEGTASALKLSDDVVQIVPNEHNGTGTFSVSSTGGTALLSVDSTNSLVKVNVNQDIANTQYAYFGNNYGDFSALVANTHYPISFMASNGGASLSTDVDFGTSDVPNTSFTTADTDTQYASQ